MLTNLDSILEELLSKQQNIFIQIFERNIIQYHFNKSFAKNVAFLNMYFVRPSSELWLEKYIFNRGNNS